MKKSVRRKGPSTLLYTLREGERGRSGGGCFPHAVSVVLRVLFAGTSRSCTALPPRARLPPSPTPLPLLPLPFFTNPGVFFFVSGSIFRMSQSYMRLAAIPAQAILHGLRVSASGLPEPERGAGPESPLPARGEPPRGVPLGTGADGGRGEGE